jgi:hydroxymethylpyrimidine/phosphomethylpyrimidine kinase
LRVLPRSIDVAAAKIGMLASAAIVAAVADRL